MEVISTSNAPKAVGPYSQAIKANGFLFLSGQGGIDPADGRVLAGLEAQAEQTMKNIAAILAEAGVQFTDVVKTTCFQADMNDFAAFNAIYQRYFTGKPARSCIAVKDLPLGFRCEVEVVAVCR